MNSAEAGMAIEAVERRDEMNRMVVEAGVHSGVDERLQKFFTGLGLADAEPFWWSADTTYLVESQASTLPNFRPFPEMLPEQKGFFWFSRRLPLPFVPVVPAEDAIAKEKLYLRGFYWIVARAGIDDRIDPHMPVATPDPPPGDKATITMFAVMEMERWPGRIFPGRFFWWWLHKPILYDAETAAQLRRETGTQLETDEPEYERFSRLAATAFLFLHQRIVARERVRPLRSARRRMARANGDDLADLNIIVLRRVERRHVDLDSEDSEVIEWSCRWTVRGHWRQQWYPSVQLHRPKWITAHVKGPDDKPLRAPRGSLFAVIR